jgi:uncharacterized membrane protein
MKVSWRFEWVQWALLALMFALAAWVWGIAPERVPVHFGVSGQPDGYGSRFEGLFLVPLMALGIYLLMLVLPRLDPGRANYTTFAGAYRWIRLALVALLAGIHALVVASAAGHRVPFQVAMPLLMGVLFLGFGNLMGKVRPNWFVGIRTPWTLSSKVAWTRTHRAGGWLFLLLGLLFVICAFVHTEWMLFGTLGVMLAGVLALIAWSYVLWRGDPDKQPPAGTLPSGE